MLTLSAEVTAAKDKISVSPILLIEFADLNYRIASKYIELQRGTGTDGVVAGTTAFSSATATFETWNYKAGDSINISGFGANVIASVDSENELTLTTPITNDTGYTWYGFQPWEDLILGDSKVSYDTTIPEMINSLGSIGSITLTIVDWRATLRAAIVGSSPNLTDSEVHIYVKFGSTGAWLTDLLSNAVKIFSGTVSTYNIHKDKITLSLVTDLPAMPKLPQVVLAQKERIGRPIQYGDFNWAIDPRWWGTGANYYAMCRLVSWDDDTFIARYYIAGHEMNQVPAAIHSDYRNAYAFVVRDGHYLHVQAPSAATFTNGASAAYVDVAFSAGVPLSGIAAYLFLAPTALEASNTASNGGRAIDGLQTTFAYIDAVNPKLSVETFGFDQLLDCELYSTAPVSSLGLHVYFGGVEADTDEIRVRITDGTYTADTLIETAYSDAWHLFPFPTSPPTAVTLADLEGYRIEIEVLADGNAEIYNVLVRARMQDVTQEDEYLYLRCMGREFSGTWNSRKTSGNPIFFPTDVIESLLRDEGSFADANIDMTSFDLVTTYFNSTLSVQAAGSMYDIKNASTWLEEIARIWNVCLFYNVSDNKWKIKYPRAAANVFSTSGTDTPAALDIFTDTDVITSGVYTSHPIKRGTFKTLRTDIAQYHEIFTMYYKLNHGGYLGEKKSGTTGREYSSEHFMLGYVTDVNTFFGNIDDWILRQKWIVTFDTFYNAVDHEIGDIINIRHNDLNNDMLESTVNEQKWMIIAVKLNWRPNTINIKAIELV